MSPRIKFYNQTLKNEIGFDKVVSEIISYIKKDMESKYQITVGTDSPGTDEVRFTTAISVWRVGNGGRYFWTKSERVACKSLQDRIYKEAVQSITFMQELKSRLRDALGEEFFWPARRSPGAGGDNKIEVHIDVGKSGKTSDIVDAVVGMVRGYGFEAVIKPASFCASVLADRHT
jgi:hypothetical protein